MTSIETVSTGMLRAWADAGVISSARYVEEMDRRRAGLRLVINNTPPLDYELRRATKTASNGE